MRLGAAGARALAAAILLQAGCAPVPRADASRSAPIAFEPSCPGYRGVDRLKLSQQLATSESTPSAYLDQVSPPDDAGLAPAADARVVIRAAAPESVLDPMTTRAVVWQDSAGAWWYWRRTFDYGWIRRSTPQVDGSVSWEPDLYPPSAGRLPPSETARIAFLLPHPCRSADPPVWPRQIPLQSGGSRACPLDAASYLMRIQRPGLPSEEISIPCENGTMTFDLLKAVLGR